MRVYQEIVKTVEALSHCSHGASELQLRSSEEVYWPLPESMGQGFFSVIKLRPGMVMAFTNSEFSTSFAGMFEFSATPISFTYSVAGNLSMMNSKEGDPLYSCRSGFEILSCLPLGKVEASPPSKMPFKCVAIYLAPSIFFDVFNGMEQFVPRSLANIAKGTAESFFYQEAPATATVQMIVQDILACLYQGPYRRLFMESKAMELMTQSLWRACQKIQGEETAGLRAVDIERVTNAKKFMDVNFRKDIKLLDLAQYVGLPHTKLNLYFRQLYGTTVFGYLRELRISEARSLLSDGKVNVTEAAYSVGYSSLSHFAKVFKKHCGQAPGDYMRLFSKPS